MYCLLKLIIPQESVFVHLYRIFAAGKKYGKIYVLNTKINLYKFMQLEKVFSSFGLSASSAELVTLVLVLLAITVAFWLLIGRFRLHSVLLNIYISFALVGAIPKDVIGANVNLLVLIFLILIILLTLMGKYTFDIHLSGSGLAYWQLLLMSFLEVGLIASIMATFVGDKTLLKFISKDALFYFSSPWAKFLWLALPLAFLAYINKRGK